MVSKEEFIGLYGNKKTIKAYIHALNNFEKFLGVSLDIYFDGVKKARKDNMDAYDEAIAKIKGDVTRWVQNLKTVGYYDKKTKKMKSYSPKAIQQMSGALRAFLNENNVILLKSFWKRLKITGQALTKDIKPNKEMLRRIVSYLDLLSKTIFLIRISCGIRMVDILDLEEHQFDFTKTPTRLHYFNHKVERWDDTFITREATETLKEWIRNKDARMKIYRSSYKFGKKPEQTFEDFYTQQTNKDKLFPISYKQISDRYNRALEQSGLGERDKQTGIHLFHEQTLRKYVKTEAARATSDAVADAIIGHTKGVNSLESVYNRHSDSIDEFAKDYLKAEPYLSLTIEVQPTTELEQVNKRLEKTEGKLESKDQKIGEIQKANEDHFQIIQMLLKKIDELQTDIDHRNKAILDHQQYELEKRMEQEHKKLETPESVAEKRRKFLEGSEMVLKQLKSGGASNKDIEQYQKTIQQGLKLF